MADSKRPGLSEAELEILKVLWDHGPATVRRILDLVQSQGRRWAYNTVLTYVQRMEGKGFVKSDKSELAHVFRSAISRDVLLRKRLQDLADQLCEGGAGPLVHALVESKRFTAEDISRFRTLLDELEQRQSRSRAR